MSVGAALAGAAVAVAVGLAVTGPTRVRRRDLAVRSTSGAAPGPSWPTPHASPAGRSRVRSAAMPGPRPGIAVAAVIVAAVAVGVAAAVGPTVTLGVTGLVGACRMAQVRAERRRRRRAVEAAVPDLVDLFVLAASAGHPVPQCLERVAARAPAAVRPVVASARDRTIAGEPAANALEPLRVALGDLGPHLVDALLAGLRTGAPLVPTLEAVAASARDRRRRSAEEQARRLPVTLLFPLVGCVLPAFGLLAVVPLLVASLGSLSL